MKLVIATVILVGVAFVAWFLLRPSSSPRDGAFSTFATPTTEARSEELDAQDVAVRSIERVPPPPAEPPKLELHTTTLIVRSSIGLALPFIEWQTRESEWLRIDLEEQRGEFGSMTMPCNVRAPGHLAARVSAGGEEVVLEPDALLVLESTGLRQCTMSIHPSDPFTDPHGTASSMRPELRRAIAWGWISDDRWALAVSSELAREGAGGRPMEAVLRWRDGRRADVHFAATAHARGSWSVPCDSFVDVAPLDVHVVRDGSDSIGPLEIQIVRVVEGGPSGGTEEHPWGSVVTYAPEIFWQDAIVAGGAEDWHVDVVPTGALISLAARDQVTSAYGRLVFVHDGTRRTLELRPAFELTGRVVADSTSAPVGVTDLTWSFVEQGKNVWAWSSEARALELAADGGFRLRGPTNLLTNRDSPLIPPSQLLLRIEAPGFESFEQLFDTGGASRFDCGEMRLTSARGELVLAAGHGLSPKSVRWESVQCAGSRDVWWTVRDAVPMSDGRLELFLIRSKRDAKLLQTGPNREGAAWPIPPPKRLQIHVVLEDRDEPWAFERDAEGSYAPVARAQHDILVECRALPGDGQTWRIGWQWHELWGEFAGGNSLRPGEANRLSFSTPAEDATLYWSTTGRPPRPTDPGGSIPLHALAETLVLQ